MITATKGARFFQGKNVGRLFHHAKEIFCARIICTDFAELAEGEETAEDAGPNGVACVRDRSRNCFRLLVARLYHPESNAFRRARTDPGHLPKLSDQLSKCGWVFDPLHNRGAKGSVAGVGSFDIL